MEVVRQHRRCMWVNGPVIVGAGPSGLAVGACLRDDNVPFMILERSDCIASLWQKRMYDRLKLHLPKQFCQLPKLPFPEDFPEYPTKNQFISYLESYARKFEIFPRFNECVQSAWYDKGHGMWRVWTVKSTGDEEELMEYICRWIVVATGENAQTVTAEIDGMDEYAGPIIHASEYKSGEAYQGKQVLVVGCGNSGMELSLDLCHHHAFPSMVVRDSIHVLPREILGKSTFWVSMIMMRWVPLWMVDKFLVFIAWMVLGKMSKYGLKRPSIGPMQLKNQKGNSPVLDIGALEKIKSGEIKVVPGIKRFIHGGVELVDGCVLPIDSVILATGYRNNVSSWLLHDSLGEFPCGWKGDGGLYAVGFSRRGLFGAAMDAVRIAEDIGRIWKEDTKQAIKLKWVPEELHLI